MYSAAMNRASSLFLALALIAAAACKKDEGGGASSTSSTSSEKGAAKAAAGPTALPDLGLQIDAPGKIEVGKAIGGPGHMLQGSGIGAMQIEATDKAETLAEAKEDADMYTPKNLKEETLGDGWALTFENTGGMGTNYWVKVRREIDGKSYVCTTTGSEASQAAAVLAACKTLRK